MFSLDFSLFFDNSIMVLLIFFFFIIFNLFLITTLLIIFKSNKTINLSSIKNIFSLKKPTKNHIYLNYFDSYNSLKDVFFVSDSRPVALNYSYISYIPC